MAPLARPLLVVSDTHLGRHTPARLGQDLARLIDAHRGAELVLGGDVVDLSHAPRHDEQRDLLTTILGDAPELVGALRRHVSESHPVTFLPGNHDAGLNDAEMAAILRGRLGVTADAPISVSPWFVRRGDVHLEHGHVYDPDNAPIHPLAEWSEISEPLGIALTRRFVAAEGAAHFSHAQDATPVRSLARAFWIYKHRAPGMIARYFRTAIALCLEGGPGLGHRASHEREVGAARVEAFSQASGVPSSALLDVLSCVPQPTHLSRREIFLRLYFDRVFASLTLVSSIAAIPRRPAASLLALASFAYLAGSTIGGHDRYGALPRERLRAGASRVREVTGARLVVFGHTHHEVVEEGYLNTGSFAFPRATGRPYVFIDERGASELRRFAG